MIILRLLDFLFISVFVGLVITQYIIPVIHGTETFWLFRKNNPRKKLRKLQIELGNTLDFKRVKEIKEEIRKIKAS